MAEDASERLGTNTGEAWALLAVRLQDRPGSAGSRKQQLTSHLECVAAHRCWLRVASSLRESPMATPEGGLWAMRARDKGHRVEALVASDPFTQQGLRDR